MHTGQDKNLEPLWKIVLYLKKLADLNTRQFTLRHNQPSIVEVNLERLIQDFVLIKIFYFVFSSGCGRSIQVSGGYSCRPSPAVVRQRSACCHFSIESRTVCSRKSSKKYADTK